jgi:sporulation protein YlmC with PRC-barrel domain
MAGGICFGDDKMVPPAANHTDMKDKMAENAMTWRLSKYIGRDIYNDQNKKIGEVKDVVLDGNANRISYAVASYGGVMGIGDKMFAMPWHSLEAKNGKLYITIPEDSLKTAPGFDEKNWPDMADAKFRSDVDSYYREHRMDKNAETPAEKRMDAAAEKAGPTDKKGLVWCRRVSKVIGADVHNKTDDNLGDIKDLVIDAHTGHVLYAVLSYGGVLGMGDKLFAVPMDALQSKADDDKFVLDASKDQLKNAPGFDKNNWPDFASADFRNSVRDFYHTQERPMREAKTPMD